MLCQAVCVHAAAGGAHPCCGRSHDCKGRWLRSRQWQQAANIGVSIDQGHRQRQKPQPQQAQLRREGVACPASLTHLTHSAVYLGVPLPSWSVKTNAARRKQAAGWWLNEAAGHLHVCYSATGDLVGCVSDPTLPSQRRLTWLIVAVRPAACDSNKATGVGTDTKQHGSVHILSQQ